MSEESIRKIALGNDHEERVHFLRQLLQRSEQPEQVLLEALQQKEPDLVLAVLEVLEDRDELPTRPIMVRLFQFLEEAEWSLQERVVHLLLVRGPRVLPLVMEIAQQDQDMEDLVDEGFGVAGAVLFAQPREALDGIILDHLIPQLAQYPQEVVPALVFVLARGLKEWWDIAIQTLERIGFPNNAIAIPIVIVHASDYNDPALDDALHLLMAWGSERVVPYLLDALWDAGRSGRYYWARLWDIAELLLILLRFNRAYVLPCGPMVSLLVSRAAFEPTPPIAVSLLLQVLETIGPECANYALPALLDLIQREGTSELAQRARRLLASFDAAALDPYRLLMDSLGIRLEED